AAREHGGADPLVGARAAPAHHALRRRARCPQGRLLYCRAARRAGQHAGAALRAAATERRRRLNSPVSRRQRYRRLGGLLSPSVCLPNGWQTTGAEMSIAGPMLLSLGSINADFQIRIDQPPDTGRTLIGRDFLRFSGGKAANV